MSKVAKLAEDAVGALGVESTDAWSCAQLRMTVASSRNRNVLNLSSQATLCFSPILGIVDRKDESGQSNPITRSYKTIQNMDSQAWVEKTCLFWTAQELQVKTRLKEVELLSAKRRNQLPSAAVCPLLLDIDAPEYGACSPTTINYKLNSHCQNQSKNNQQ